MTGALLRRRPARAPRASPAGAAVVEGPRGGGAGPCAFHADWRRVLFLHFEVLEEAPLAAVVPLPLDRHGGRAWVSLVAFEQERFRPRLGGGLAAWLARPFSRHAFLNARTYVRHGETRGIYFLSEWISRRLPLLVAPVLYGLPYRHGRLLVEHDDGRRIRFGRLETDDRRAAIAWRAVLDPDERLEVARAGTLDEFLVERYVAWTSRRGVLRRFAIAHEPWRLARPAVRVLDQGLLAAAGLGPARLRYRFAHGGPGVQDVAIWPPVTCGRIRARGTEEPRARGPLRQRP